MSKRIIAKNLTKALLNGGKFAKALFDFELADHVGEFMLSKKQGNYNYFYVVVENTNDVAMLLIDENDVIHINESAREHLQTLFRDFYKRNIKKEIPRMAKQLDAGSLFTVGIKPN